MSRVGFHFLLLLSPLCAHTAFEGISEAYPQSLLPGVLFGDFLIKGRKWHINKTVRLPLHGFKCMFYNLVLCPLFLNIFVCTGEAISLFFCLYFSLYKFIYLLFFLVFETESKCDSGWPCILGPLVSTPQVLELYSCVPPFCF